MAHAENCECYAWPTCSNCCGGGPATQCGTDSRAASAYMAAWSLPSATYRMHSDMSFPTTYILQIDSRTLELAHLTSC
jgi:hypothetical protein